MAVRIVTVRLPVDIDNELENAIRVRKDYGTTDVALLRDDIILEALVEYFGKDADWMTRSERGLGAHLTAS